MKTILFLFCALFSSISFAKFTPYLGVNLGYTSSSPKDEESKSGSTYGGKFLGSFDSKDSNWIHDIGLGYQSTNVKGDDSSILNSEVEITRKSFLLEYTPQYMMNSSFSLGPIVSSLMGSDSKLADELESDNQIFHLGLRANYHGKIKDKYPWRLEGTINISPDETKEMNVLVGILFGWPEQEKKQEVKKEEPKKVAVKKVPQIPFDDEVPDVTITIKSARVLFDTAVYAIDPELRHRLKEFALYLKENPSLWGRVRISGHTDSRGTDEYNDNLSKNRAQSVLDVFKEMGVPEDKMWARGYGERRPLDKREIPEAWAKNRRTEIEFFEVSRPKEFNDALMLILTRPLVKKP